MDRSKTSLVIVLSIFAMHGLPEVLAIVTDNGTVFMSHEFQQFMKNNGIRHVKTAPYHLVSNGLVGRAVQTFKENMKKTSGDSIETRVARFLFQYRITPHTTTGTSPTELLLSKVPRSHLDLTKPAISQKVSKKLRKQKAGHDSHTTDRYFNINDSVFVHESTSNSE